MKRTFTTIASLAVVCVLAVSGPAQAEVLVADSFSYSDGDLVGNNGGWSLDGDDQWSGPWQAAADLAAPAGEIVVSGNQVTAGLDFSVTLGVERPIDNNQGETTQYFGFDLKHYGDPVVDELFGFGIDIPGYGGPTSIVIGYTDGDNWVVHGNILTEGRTGGAFAPGVWHRVVVRFAFNVNAGVNEQLTVWVNPTSEGDTPEFTTPDGVPFADSQDMGITTLDGLTLQIIGRKNYADPPTWGLDRLNLTTTFAEARDGVIWVGIPGDVNGDGWVGGVDLNRVINNWGQTGLGRAGGDLNDNGTVDGPDYSEVLTYWGTGQPLEPPSEVTPEPSTLLALLATAALAGIIRRR